MEMHLPQDVQAGLDAARRKSQSVSPRLRIEAGGRSHRVLRAWPGGFALDAAEAAHLRGLVDLFDGARHLSRGLIVAAAEDGGERCFDYKRMTDATDAQPADFERGSDAPAALLEAPRTGV